MRFRCAGSGTRRVGGGNSYLSQAEVFDPDTVQWIATDSMHVVRFGHTATRLLDGRVLVTGGWCNFGPCRFTEVWDPAADSWTLTTKMEQERYFHLAALLPDGRVLVTGGSCDGVSCFRSEAYDPTTATWSPLPDIPGDHDRAVAVTIPDGTVVIVGGWTYNRESADTTAFDPESNTWIGLPLHIARFEHQAVVLHDGRILVAGGDVEGVRILPSVEYLTPRGLQGTGRVMQGTLATERGRTLYTKRGHMVEPVFGRITRGPLKTPLPWTDPRRWSRSLAVAMSSSGPCD